MITIANEPYDTMMNRRGKSYHNNTTVARASSPFKGVWVTPNCRSLVILKHAGVAALELILCCNEVPQESINVLEVPRLGNCVVVRTIGKLSPYLRCFADLIQAGHMGRSVAVD